MPNLEIKQLFNHKRFPDELKFFWFLLYLPLGIVLFALRIILALCVVLVGCSLSDSSIIHKLVNILARLTLGISVTVENAEKKEDVDVYISNSLSHFDRLAVHTVTRSVSPSSNVHPALSRGFGCHFFGSQASLETFKKNISLFMAEHKVPVYFFPEDKITNGKALLKFKTYPFSLATKVQPICLTVRRPVFDISISTLGSSYWADVLFYMISPLTVYNVKFLTSLEKKDLSDNEFAAAVRQSIASALKIEPVDYSTSDVSEWEKRWLAEQERQPPVVRSTRGDGEIRRMASQVKEVLPHVPLSAIIKDLSRTRSVDDTITNILEGRVQFVSEQPSSVPQPSTSSGVSTKPTASPTSSNDRDLFNTAASSFPKSAHERTKSFQERKEQLIANARRRYIEKHNLDIPF